MEKRYIGDKVRLSCKWWDMDGEPADPTTVELQIESRDGVMKLTVESGDVIREEEGHYYYNLLLETSGRWKWRWVGTGAAAKVDQGEFYVEPRNVSIS